MSKFPTNAALEKAIVADADEDTPRLAYADWLQENGDPERAEFIRVQVRLADMSPAEPEWVDLTERQAELSARLKSRLHDLQPADPDEFYTGYDFTDDHEEPFRRGFPFFIDCMADAYEWEEKEEGVFKEIARLVRTTTFRGFSFDDLPLDVLKRLLAEPVAAEFRGLAFFPYANTNDWRGEFAQIYRLLGSSPALRGVQQLFLYGAGSPLPAGVLAKAKTFDSVRRLVIQNVSGTKADLEALTGSKWFRRLRHFRCFLDTHAVTGPMLTGLGKLPELHTLDLPEVTSGGAKALAAGEFPALARLIYNGPLGLEYAKLLAKASFPSLAVLEASGGMKNDDLSALLQAKWFRQLRVLDLSGNAIGDKGLKALAAHPVAKTLRVLNLGGNSFGKSGLAALAAPGAFPALTTLGLASSGSRKAKPAELAAWLASLRLPNLRHLDLDGWPLGSAGAKALAANPAFASLTRLNLGYCKIGGPGAAAVFASPHLQNLVELQMGSNSIRTGTEALANKNTMPRLGECYLGGNSIPRKTAERLERDGLHLYA